MLKVAEIVELALVLLGVDEVVTLAKVKIGPML